MRSEIAAGLPKAPANLETLKLDLEKILTAQGLFAAEAHAMVETWRDSWFDEGTRVFYIVPADEMESILPLQVEPQPAIARVFVGRVEVITPEMKNVISTALQQRDRQTLEKYGRFLQPILGSVAVPALAREVFQKYLRLDTACATGKAW